MAIQRDRAPYGSTGPTKTVIEKHRQVGLPVMNLQRLQQIGVSEALAPRTMHTLISLGFYDENGNVTPEFDALRHVPEHDFKPRLAALLREAYAPILEVLDPATATPLDVENAFRGYKPTGQLLRMVQLFMGLMIYAGLMPENRRRASTGEGRPTGSRTGGNTGSKKKDGGSGGVTGGVTGQAARGTPPPPLAPPDGSIDAMKRMYFDLLIEKAKQPDADGGLLDRIERLVGLEPLPDKKEDRGWTTAGSKPATPPSPASQEEG